MKKFISIGFLVFTMSLLFGCDGPTTTPAMTTRISAVQEPDYLPEYPRIASWLAKKDEIIASQKPYSLVMSGWFTQEEALLIKSHSPDAVLLAGLSINWVWDNPDWMTFLTTVASYGRTPSFAISDDMYLKNQDGSRCAFGWKSENWGHEEIYAMDTRNPGWIELISSFYRNVLIQPQHDGIIVDMVLEKSLFPDVISDQEWVESTSKIMEGIEELNTGNKLVIFNSGRDISEIDAYSRFMDGYVMENFMGEQLLSTFEEGLKAADSGYIVIYAVDTDDSGEKDLKKMRLGLILSLLNDNTYFTYDFGPRDHGQAWWFSEFEADLGKPLGNYYKDDQAYYREFEKGIVVASPHSRATITLDTEFIDLTTGQKSISFVIDEGDGRIFLITPQ